MIIVELEITNKIYLNGFFVALQIKNVQPRRYRGHSTVYRHFCLTPNIRKISQSMENLPRTENV